MTLLGPAKFRFDRNRSVLVNVSPAAYLRCRSHFCTSRKLGTDGITSLLGIRPNGVCGRANSGVSNSVTIVLRSSSNMGGMVRSTRMSGTVACCCIGDNDRTIGIKNILGLPSALGSNSCEICMTSGYSGSTS